MRKAYPITETTISRRTFINKMKSKRRMKEIGSGCFAEVYASKSGRTVVKVGDIPDIDWTGHANLQYLRYISLIEQHQDNPYFPKIKSVQLFRHKRTEEYYFAVEMERLKPLKYGTGSAVSSTLEQLLDDEDSLPAIKMLFGDVSKHLKQAHKVMQKMMNKYGACLDIHSENVMIRKRGQVVITDPVT